MAGFWQVILAFRKYLIIVLVPLVLLPLPLAIPTKEAECGYAIIVMALYWCLEALPLAVTAFLPVILFPMMKIMDSTTRLENDGQEWLSSESDIWEPCEPWARHKPEQETTAPSTAELGAV